MDWLTIKKEYENTDTTLKALADKYGIKDSTIRSRKNREKWQRNATQRKNTATKKTENKSLHNKKIEPFELSDQLTDKQRLFCIYYLKYFNATKAYQKAYDCAYSTAGVEGHRLLKNPKVRNEINFIKSEQAEELKLDAKDVLQKYIDIAFADITDFTDFGQKEVIIDVDEDGNEKKAVVNYVDIKDSNRIDGTILTEVKQGKEGITVKLADKMKALEKLEKYFDLLPDHHKRKLEEEKSILDKKKYELDKRVVELREREESKKAW